MALAPRFAALVAAHGAVLLAGLLEPDAGEVTAAYAPWFELKPFATARAGLRCRDGAEPRYGSKCSPVCPKCGLMLVVTAADLRAAQGHVRCGRCRSVFNALESLAESAPHDSAAADRPAVAAPPLEPNAAAEAAQSSPAGDFEWMEPEREPQWAPEPTVDVQPPPPALEAQALPPEPQHEEPGAACRRRSRRSRSARSRACPAGAGAPAPAAG